MAPNQEAAMATTTRRQLTSDVWRSFRINRPAASGGRPTATCEECGETLCAGGSIGTSHLRRHTRSNKCQQLAAERRKPNSAAEAPPAPPPPGNQEEEGQYSTSPPVYASEEELFFVVDGIDIPELFDDLMEKNLVNIDVSPLPQATSNSTKWYLQKKKERYSAGASATTHGHSHASKK